MKQCPVCKTTYTDQSLKFCLADGSVLADNLTGDPTVVQQASDLYSGETVAMVSSGEKVRVEIPQPSVPTFPRAVVPPPVSTAGAPSGNLLKILIVIIGLGIMALLAVVAAALIYFNMGGPEKSANLVNKNTRSAASPSPTPTKDPQDELRDQIANLEKLVNEQKKEIKTANVPQTNQDQSGSATTARVNSPADGFLALRSMPSSSTGSRVLQIPHGSTIVVGGCLNSMTIGGRTGRWCRASYDGYTGWVFDAFLIY